MSLTRLFLKGLRTKADYKAVKKSKVPRRVAKRSAHKMVNKIFR